MEPYYYSSLFFIEVFRPVVGYEGLYEVSNMGRIRSLDKICPIGKYGNVVKVGRILKPEIKFGYMLVRLYKGGGRRSEFVHRLVGIAFIPNPENKPEINHIKAIKTSNNHLSIEWVTPTENMDHASKMGLLKRVGNRASKRFAA